MANRRNIFHISLILLCLEYVDRGVAGEIIQKWTDELLRERSGHWSWNYNWREREHSREKGSHLTAPYPDDLDDTFCALSAIATYRPEVIDGAALAHIVKLLTTNEAQPGGPYYTWLYSGPDEEKWRDIDPVVNANIAFFLRRHQQIILPNITEYLRETVTRILAHAFSDQSSDTPSTFSKYYHLPVSILYFISRACPEAGEHHEKKLIKYLTETEWANPLETALALSSLVSFGLIDIDEKSDRTNAKSVRKRAHTMADDIISHRQPDASWKAYPLYIEKINSSGRHYSGSTALTTAFCLEALAKLERAKKSEGAVNTEKVEVMAKMARIENEIKSTIVQRLISRFDTLPALQKHIHTPLEKVTSGTAGKYVTLLPYFFYTSLKPQAKRNITNSLGSDVAVEDLLIDLGVANLAGWVSYRIYDDILDEEGRPEILPLANTCLRIVSEIYTRHLPADHRHYFDTIMNNLETANTIEREQSFQKELRINHSLPLTDYANNDYALLVDKSLPHCLGPVTILAILGETENSTDCDCSIPHTIDYFRHYIIARQLNDDAHDWLRDLKRGFLNSASVEVIKHWKKTLFPDDTSAHRVEEIESDLQSIFWHTAIIPIAERIQDHVRKAGESIRKVKGLADTSIFDALLTSLANAATQALDERQQMLDFLRTLNENGNKK